MLVTFKHNSQYATVQAPLGAGAFAVFVDPKVENQLHIVFAMIQEGDKNALETLQRVRKAATTLSWKPTTARPELYQAPYYDVNKFVEYVFRETNGVWMPENDVLANYLAAMQISQGSPAKPPKELAYDMAALI